MALETVEREIDGITFRVTQLPFKKSRALLARVMGILGPALSDLANAKSDGTTAMAKLAGALGERVKVEDMDYLDSVLGPVTEMQAENGFVPLTTAAIEHHFEGNQLRWFKWQAFALEVQFADFFAGLGRSKSGSASR